MNDKIRVLIVSNKKQGLHLRRVVDVHLSYIYEDSKTQFCLTFVSDIWNQGYFLPLNHIKKNGKVSSLHMFQLHHEILGYNLDEIWKSEDISLFSFLNNSLESENQELKEEFETKVTKFMYRFLEIPSEQTIKILNWIYKSNYTHYTGKSVLLTTFQIK